MGNCSAFHNFHTSNKRQTKLRITRDDDDAGEVVVVEGEVAEWRGGIWKTSAQQQNRTVYRSIKCNVPLCVCVHLPNQPFLRTLKTKKNCEPTTTTTTKGTRTTTTTITIKCKIRSSGGRSKANRAALCLGAVLRCFAVDFSYNYKSMEKTRIEPEPNQTQPELIANWSRGEPTKRNWSRSWTWASSMRRNRAKNNKP